MQIPRNDVSFSVALLLMHHGYYLTRRAWLSGADDGYPAYTFKGNRHSNRELVIKYTLPIGNQYLEVGTWKPGPLDFLAEDWLIHPVSNPNTLPHEPPGLLMNAARNDASFSAALVLLKKGHKVCRRGWADSNTHPPGAFLHLHLEHPFRDQQGATVQFTLKLHGIHQDAPYMTWRPSYEDLLAEDWALHYSDESLAQAA